MISGYLNKIRKNRWVKLAALFLILIAISFGLAVLFNRLLHPLEERIQDFAWLAYLIVFGTSLLSNLTVIAPVAVGAAVMMTAADFYHPVVVALFAAIGGTLGELGGYYAGSLGKNVLANEYPEAYDRVAGWVDRYGMWAISFLAFQPLIPFDIAGLVAGASKMPAPKFVLACFLGKFPKYIILVYFFTQLKHFMPYM
ncbi:MAG: hypothetical protein A2Y72_05590 [Chloroflexi bacterium RBG_13_53_26]|nr:MAG: hypothetical protein A2Y72_05590 [Chloroflexi bacterium RBG_13_53_26]